MIIADLVIAFAVALVLAFILVWVFGWRRPGAEGAAAAATIWFVLILLLTATWAGGVWLRPVTDVTWAADWVGFVFVGIVFALLLLAIAPPAPRELSPREAEIQAETELTAAAGITVFLWVLLALLVIAIIANYTLEPLPVA